MFVISLLKWERSGWEKKHTKTIIFNDTQISLRRKILFPRFAPTFCLSPPTEEVSVGALRRRQRRWRSWKQVLTRMEGDHLRQFRLGNSFSTMSNYITFIFSLIRFRRTEWEAPWLKRWRRGALRGGGREIARTQKTQRHDKVLIIKEKLLPTPLCSIFEETFRPNVSLATKPRTSLNPFASFSSPPPLGWHGISMFIRKRYYILCFALWHISLSPGPANTGKISQQARIKWFSERENVFALPAFAIHDFNSDKTSTHSLNGWESEGKSHAEPLREKKERSEAMEGRTGFLLLRELF